MTTVESWGRSHLVLHLVLGWLSLVFGRRAERVMQCGSLLLLFWPQIPFFLLLSFQFWNKLLWKCLMLENCPQCQDPAVTSYTDQHYLFMGWVFVLFLCPLRHFVLLRCLEYEVHSNVSLNKTRVEWLGPGYVLCVFVLLQDLMEHFNPGLQKLVDLGNSYVKAFQGMSDDLRAAAL